MKKVTVTYTKPSDKVFFVNSTLTTEQLASLASLRAYKYAEPSIKSYSFRVVGDTTELFYTVNTEEDYNNLLTYMQANFSYITDETAYNAANGITRSVTIEDII